MLKRIKSEIALETGDPINKWKLLSEPHIIINTNNQRLGLTTSHLIDKR